MSWRRIKYLMCRVGLSSWFAVWALAILLFMGIWWWQRGLVGVAPGHATAARLVHRARMAIDPRGEGCDILSQNKHGIHIRTTCGYTCFAKFHLRPPSPTQFILQ